MAIEVYTNGAASTLNGSILVGDLTMIPTSYGPFPATGQTRVLLDTELILITDLAARPWTISRGTEGTSAAGHVNTSIITQVFTAAGIINVLPNVLNGLDTTTPVLLQHTANTDALEILNSGTRRSLFVTGTSTFSVDQAGLVEINPTLSISVGTHAAAVRIRPTVTLPSGNIIEYYHAEYSGSITFTRTSQTAGYMRLGQGATVTINTGVTPNLLGTLILDYPTVNLAGGNRPSNEATLFILSAPAGGRSIADFSAGAWYTGTGGLTVPGGGLAVTGLTTLYSGLTTWNGLTVSSGLTQLSNGLNVNGLTNLFNGLTILNGLTVSSGLTQLNNGLNVHGLASIYNGMNIAGSLNVIDGGLVVQAGGLNVNGASLFNNGLTASGGRTTINNGLTVSGASQYNNGLLIWNGLVVYTGLTQLNNGLTVNGRIQANTVGVVGKPLTTKVPGNSAAFVETGGTVYGSRNMFVVSGLPVEAVECTLFIVAGEYVGGQILVYPDNTAVTVAGVVRNTAGMGMAGQVVVPIGNIPGSICLELSPSAAGMHFGIWLIDYTVPA